MHDYSNLYDIFFKNCQAIAQEQLYKFLEYMIFVVIHCHM